MKKIAIPVLHLPVAREVILQATVDHSTENHGKHPGMILLNNFINPLGLTVIRLSVALHVNSQRLYDTIRGTRGMTAELALRLAKYFGITAEYWMDLQTNYELAEARAKWGQTIDREIRTLPAVDTAGLSVQILEDKGRETGNDLLGGSSSGDGDGSEEESEEAAEKQKYDRLTEEQKKVYDLISDTPVCFDVLMAQSGLDVGTLNVITAELELEEKMIVRVPGDSYVRAIPPVKRFRGRPRVANRATH